MVEGIEKIVNKLNQIVFHDIVENDDKSLVRIDYYRHVMLNRQTR